MWNAKYSLLAKYAEIPRTKKSVEEKVKGIILFQGGNICCYPFGSQRRLYFTIDQYLDYVI